jgi:hypothetical protein
MANGSGSLAGDLPDPSKPGPGVGLGSLSSNLPDPSEVPQAIAAAPLAPEQPRNPTMDAAAGPGVRMEVDFATVREVIKGYEHEISELIKAEMEIRIGLNIDQPGEEEASGTYTNDHYAPAESLREALRSQRDALQTRHDNLVAVVRQYERTEAVNKSDLRRHS